MINNTIIEICAGSLTDCLTAQSVPETDRIELNCSLELGGITPSLNTLKMAKEMVTKPIICMVRPRPAGFIYNEEEKESMYRDAETFLENGADGIVFGVLRQDHTVDEEYALRMTDLIHSYGKEAVFHKAFDNTPDPFAAMEALIRCGIDRVLTSGQKPSTVQGIPLIKELISRYGGQISILPGGGVNETNALRIVRETGSGQIHMTAKTTLQDDGAYYAVSAEQIRKVLNSMSSAKKPHSVLTREDADMLKNDHYESDMNDCEDDERR